MRVAVNLWYCACLQFSLVLLLITEFSRKSSANEFYVAAPNGAPCPLNTTCHKLSFYTSQLDMGYFVSNTIFYFLEGTHELTNHRHFVIANITNLTLQGIGEMVEGFHETVRQTKVIITCTFPPDYFGNSGLAFIHSFNITMNNITISNCASGGIFSKPIDNFFIRSIELESFVFKMRVFNLSVVALEVYNLSLQFASIQNSSGFGFFAVNSYNAKISHSTFARNNQYTFTKGCEVVYCRGGNVAVFYTNPTACISTTAMYSLHITWTNVSFGVDLFGATLGESTGGLFIAFEQQNTYGVDVLIDHVVAYGNTGLMGANIRIDGYKGVTQYRITINNTISSYGNRVFSRTRNTSAYVSVGGGLVFNTGIDSLIGRSSCVHEDSLFHPNTRILTVENSNFSHNFAYHGGGVMMYLNGEAGLYTIGVNSCRLSSNYGWKPIALGIRTFWEFGSSISVHIKDVTISGSIPLAENSHNPSTSSSLVTVAVYLSAILNCTIHNIAVVGNRGTGILMDHTAVLFFGANNLFEDNIGMNGGAMSLLGNSLLSLHPHTVVSFINNRAIMKGGALYIDNSEIVNPGCFFNVHVTSYDELDYVLTKKFIFSGNTAGQAGSVLYGGDLETCLHRGNGLYRQVFSYFFNKKSPARELLLNVTSAIFRNLSNFTNQTGLTVVSSDSMKICFCNGSDPHYSSTHMKAVVYPGNNVQIPFAMIGQWNGLSLGTLKIEEVVNGTTVRVLLNSTQPRCENLNYRIIQDHDANSSLLLLSVYDNANMDPTSSSVAISIPDCPIGFTLSHSGVCDCDPYLTRSLDNVTCNISSQNLSRTGAAWIGHDTVQSCLIVENHCPFDYCKPGLVAFSITDSDSQCSLNRSGILCGGCASGMSLLLGSNRCGECSNAYVTILLPMALAGFALVVILIVLNLTVSVGTINGLIFYANVIKLAEPVYFPAGSMPALSHFISWLNLDLGIETCLYHGMDAYAKVWLQFVFPFYLWMIMVVIAITTHYSTIASKIISRNTISVLATLVLLSYMKLFRAVTLVLFVQVLKCDSAHQIVWYVDANVGYFQVKHLLLCIFALTVLLVLAIPYTLVLLFSSLIEHMLPKIRCLRKIYNTAKPFYDAYGGPYEDKHHFWTGLLLLARLVLMIVVSFSGSNNTILSAVVSVCAVILALAWLSRGVYHIYYLNVLESSFLINLILLSGLTANGKAWIGVLVCVTSALVTFIGITTYHVHVQLKSARCIKKIKEHMVTPKQYQLLHPVTSSSGASDPDRPDIVVDDKARKPECTTVLMRRESLLDLHDENIAKAHVIRYE